MNEWFSQDAWNKQRQYMFLCLYTSLWSVSEYMEDINGPTQNDHVLRDHSDIIYIIVLSFLLQGRLVITV